MKEEWETIMEGKNGTFTILGLVASRQNWPRIKPLLVRYRDASQ